MEKYYFLQTNWKSDRKLGLAPPNGKFSWPHSIDYVKPNMPTKFHENRLFKTENTEGAQCALPKLDGVES